MPRPKAIVPKLCVDKSRNRAFCKVRGNFVSLGTAGSAAAQEAYGNLLASLARGETVEKAKAVRKSQPKSTSIALNDLMLRFPQSWPSLHLHPLFAPEISGIRAGFAGSARCLPALYRHVDQRSP